MAELSNQKKKQLAERLFVYNDMSGKEIAAELQVAEQTVSRWRTEGKWEELRAAVTTGSDELIRLLLQENLAIISDAKKEGRRLNAKESDALLKNAKAIKTLSKEDNTVSAIMVFKRYNNWLVAVNPTLATANTDFQKRFLYSLNADE